MRKGFTLLELIIVVIIVAILAGLGIPQFIKVVERAKAAEGVNVLGAFRSSQLRYYAENQSYATDISKLDVGVPTTLKNFSYDAANLSCTVANTCGAGGNCKICQIVRAGASAYTLSIADNGLIYCTPSTTCPAGFN